MPERKVTDKVLCVSECVKFPIAWPDSDTLPANIAQCNELFFWMFQLSARSPVWQVSAQPWAEEYKQAEDRRLLTQDCKIWIILNILIQVRLHQERGQYRGGWPVLPLACGLWQQGMWDLEVPVTITCIAHMCLFQIGLDTLALFCKKKSYGTRINNKLYCSQITKQFVLKKFPLFPEKVLIKADFLTAFPRRDVDSLESNCTPLLCDIEKIFQYLK